MTRTNIPRQVLDFQKQILDFQRAAFENGYDAIVALQERQLELADRMMNQVPNLPDEARELIQTWRPHLDRLAGGTADDEAPDQAQTTHEAHEETVE